MHAPLVSRGHYWRLLSPLPTSLCSSLCRRLSNKLLVGLQAAPAPLASFDFPIGVKIQVGNDVRRAEIQDLVALMGGRIVVATPGRRARSYAIDGSSQLMGEVPAGRWTAPLRAVRANGGIYGTLATADGVRLVRFP